MTAPCLKGSCMFDIIIRSFIGNAGGKILDFYLEYSLIINGIILLYFVLILVGRRNYGRVLETIVKNLKRDHGNQLKSKNPKQLNAALKKMDVPWQEGFDSIFFPIITPPGSFRLYIKNEVNLHKLFTNDVLADTLITYQKQ